MRDLLVIRTPENVAFEFELASVGTRAVAWLIDVVVMAALIYFAVLVATTVAALSEGLGAALLFVFVFLVQWWYGAILEWRWGGRTIGKRVVGLRVLGEDGLALTFPQAVIRNLVRVADLLPILYLVGGISVLVDRRARRLGDLAAGTIVVRERRAPRPAQILAAAERHNSFLADPGVRAAARRVSAPERDAMIALGLRRDRLPMAVRSELFERMAEHLGRRLGLARPSHLTPEKFVLALTAVVLGTEPMRGVR